MAEKKEQNSVQPEESVTLSRAELQQLLVSAVTAAAEQSQKGFEKIADAMLESRKPYKSPEQEANEKMWKAQMRKQWEDQQRMQKISQAHCPHFQGCNPLSDEWGNKSSILKHQLDNGVVIGMCTNCQRVFWPSDKDYVEQMQRVSGNRMSKAGQRQYIQPGQFATITD